MIFLFLFLSVLLGKIYNRIQSILFFLWIIFFATITAIRDGVGTDFESYVGIFEITPQWDSLFSTMPLVDWGFWYLNSTVKTFGGDVVVLFFFYFIYNYIVTLFCI
ncbi:EpsG family protein [Bacteroides fragilis]